MSDVIQFRVDGEPMPFPKKQINRKTGMIYCRDKDGSKRGWMQAVAHNGKEAMQLAEHFQPFGPGDAIAMTLIFYRTKPPSTPKQLSYPITKPDLDNYAYSISNALIGVVYHDDSRVVDQHIEKRWATQAHPAGVEIEIKRL